MIRELAAGMIARGVLQTASRLLSLAVPRTCLLCGSPLIGDERYVCRRCLATLPRAGALEAMARLEGICRPVAAVSVLRYTRHGDVARLLHHIKYGSAPRTARLLGRMMGAEVSGTSLLTGIDAICPVPLFAFRRFVRGYNQSRELAEGLGEVVRLPVAGNLVALRPHASQTARNAGQRRGNVSGIFGVRRPGELEGRGVLIVDDVLTTGATVAEAARALREAVPGVRISVLTLAAATPGI